MITLTPLTLFLFVVDSGLLLRVVYLTYALLIG